MRNSNRNKVKITRAKFEFVSITSMLLKIRGRFKWHKLYIYDYSLPLTLNAYRDAFSTIFSLCRLRLSRTYLYLKLLYLFFFVFRIFVAASATASNEVSHRTDACKCIRLGLKFTLGRWRSPPARRSTKAQKKRQAIVASSSLS